MFSLEVQVKLLTIYILKTHKAPHRMHGWNAECIFFNTCLSTNSRVSFSMCPSYKFVVRLMRPIFDRPKSVSLMWPIEVMRRLGEKSKVKLLRKRLRRHYSKKKVNSGASSKSSVALTCQAWGLDVRCRNYASTPEPGRSLQSTCVPFQQVAPRCSSAASRSLHLTSGIHHLISPAAQTNVSSCLFGQKYFRHDFCACKNTLT